MRLSELKPCACCKGPLLKPPCGNWYVLRESIAIIKPSALRGVAAMTMMLNGALRVAETLSPEPDAVKIISDEPGMPPPAEIHVCFECYTQKFGPLFLLFDEAERKVPEVAHV